MMCVCMCVCVMCVYYVVLVNTVVTVYFCVASGGSEVSHIMCQF